MKIMKRKKELFMIINFLMYNSKYPNSSLFLVGTDNSSKIKK